MIATEWRTIGRYMLLVSLLLAFSRIFFGGTFFWFNNGDSEKLSYDFIKTHESFVQKTREF
jgi:hypothetical protein